MGNREPLKILEQGNGLVRLADGKTHSTSGWRVSKGRGLLTSWEVIAGIWWLGSKYPSNVEEE